MTSPDVPPRSKPPADPFITADQAVKPYDLSEAEFEALFDALNWVYMAVTKADKTGYGTAQKEAQVWLDYFLAVAQQFPENQLIQQVFGAVGNKKEFHRMLGRSRKAMAADRKAHKLRGGEAWLAHSKTKLADVNRILQSKVDERDANEFRGWLLWVGQKMAEAGPRRRASDGEGAMSPKERMALIELASALGAA